MRKPQKKGIQQSAPKQQVLTLKQCTMHTQAKHLNIGSISQEWDANINQLKAKNGNKAVQNQSKA